MRVFITGATGLIGRAAVLRLLRDGHQVTAWVRSLERARSTLGAEIALVDANGGQMALQQAVDQADAVVNLAGEPILPGRWTQRRRQAIQSSRIELTEQIAAAICKAKTAPKVLVSASAIGYYGDRGDQLLDEQSGPGHGFLADLCEQWERAAARAAGADIRIAVLRIGLVLGRGDRIISNMAPLFRLGLGGPLGTGSQYLPWIHLDDVAEIIARAVVDERFAGAINTVAPDQVTNRALAQAIGKTLRRPAILPVPRLALRLVLGEAAQAVLSSQRTVPKYLERCNFQFRFDNLQGAVGDILCQADGTSISAAANQPDVPYLRDRRPHYLLAQTTTINAPIDQVFPFFSKAENLALITPPSMSFRILTPTPVDMQAGAAIDYRIQIGPAPMRWRTVIEVWEPGIKFVDSQHRGPYRAWWHEHHFQAAGDQTVMRDLVYYAPPLGILGRIANRLFVTRMLREIFDYRTMAIRLRFGLSATAVAPIV